MINLAVHFGHSINQNCDLHLKLSAVYIKPRLLTTRSASLHVCVERYRKRLRRELHIYI